MNPTQSAPFLQYIRKEIEAYQKRNSGIKTMRLHSRASKLCSCCSNLDFSNKDINCNLKHDALRIAFDLPKHLSSLIDFETQFIVRNLLNICGTWVDRLCSCASNFGHRKVLLYCSL